MFSASVPPCIGPPLFRGRGRCGRCQRVPLTSLPVIDHVSNWTTEDSTTPVLISHESEKPRRQLSTNRKEIDGKRGVRLLVPQPTEPSWLPSLVVERHSALGLKGIAQATFLVGECGEVGAVCLRGLAAGGVDGVFALGFWNWRWVGGGGSERWRCYRGNAGLWCGLGMAECRWVGGVGCYVSYWCHCAGDCSC